MLPAFILQRLYHPPFWNLPGGRAHARMCVRIGRRALSRRSALVCAHQGERNKHMLNSCRQPKQVAAIAVALTVGSLAAGRAQQVVQPPGSNGVVVSNGMAPFTETMQDMIRRDRLH